MKSRNKTGLYIFFIFLLAAGFFAWKIFGSNTGFNGDKKTLYIHTGSSFEDVLSAVEKDSILKNPGIFKWLSGQLKYNNIKPGKYTVNKGFSIFQLVKLLKSGRQTPVNLVIVKLRTTQDLAARLGNYFETDSAGFMAYLGNRDSIKSYGLDSNTLMTAIIPNTYSILWNTSPAKLFKKLFNEQEKFWTSERKKKAAALQLTTAEVYTLASIVEEETNKEEDKGKIASVYLNRLAKGMKLGADPTVKFAMKDFALKRIYFKHLTYPSPFNTYQITGLPPGPICTPSTNTLDAVLNAPKTTYLFFVAKPDFKGYSNFASTYEEHQQYAKAYQRALDSLMKSRTTSNN